MVRGWTLLIFGVKGQGHNGHIWKKDCEHDGNCTVVCFRIKLGRRMSHGERMDPIDFGGQKLRSQWTYNMEISL